MKSFDISPGTYFEFEFEVDDLDPDDDDSEEEVQQIEEFLGQIREEFPEWPSGASMRVAGTFTPEDGGPRAFKTFIEAEIEVERELDPPLEVTSDGLSRSLTVMMDPGMWFSKSDGAVQNLSQFQSTDDLLEIDNEFSNGVVEIDIDDD